MSIKVYVEGGGDSNALRTACRRGFSTFFEKAGLSGHMPRIVACGSRNDAFGSFCTALRQAKGDELPLLLVDSEILVAPANTPWTHVQVHDGWVKPPEANDGNLHLMAQCMETWLLADPETLAVYFGHGFRRLALPRRPDLEAVEKNDVLNALANASRDTRPKGEYRKGRDAFALLSNVDPTLVREKCLQAERLIAFLLRQ